MNSLREYPELFVAKHRSDFKLLAWKFYEMYSSLCAVAGVVGNKVICFVDWKYVSKQVSHLVGRLA